MKKIKFIFLVFIFLFTTVVGEQESELLGEEVQIPRVFNQFNQPFTGKVKRGLNIESYKEGLPHGTWTSYYSNGKIKQKSNWKEGILHGSYTVYNEAGNKVIENSYYNGKDHGKYTLRYPNGKNLIIGYFEHGHPSGTWKYYSEKGKLTSKNNIKKN